MTELVVEGLTKVYPGGVAAVSGLDLRVADGEIVVIVGPSGCGKTTTLRMIAGLETVTAGTVAIGGRSVTGRPPRDRGVAMVFQEDAVYPHLTVSGNLAFAARRRPRDRAETDRRVRDAARLLDLEHLLDRRPAALSGGERRRLAVGRAVVADPACYLFDEPLRSLDAGHRGRLRSRLKTLLRSLNATVLYVTHDQAEAMSLGDRIVVMRDGRVVQTGPPGEVYRHPADRFVAGFLGDPPMSFLQGRVDNGPAFGDGHGTRLSLPPWAAPHVGRDIVLGIRPGSLHADPGGPLTMTVETVETLGDATYVTGPTPGGARLTARIDTADVGETLGLAVAPDALHLFAPGDPGPALLPHG